MMDPKNKLTEAAALDDTALENAVGGILVAGDNSPKPSIPNFPTTPADTEEENGFD